MKNQVENWILTEWKKDTSHDRDVIGRNESAVEVWMTVGGLRSAVKS